VQRNVIGSVAPPWIPSCRIGCSPRFGGFAQRTDRPPRQSMGDRVPNLPDRRRVALEVLAELRPPSLPDAPARQGDNTTGPVPSHMLKALITTRTMTKITT
jgi:hypothetical protein